MANKRLGELLLSAGMLTEEQLQTALQEQQFVGGKPWTTVLLERGFLTQKQLFQTLEQQLGISSVDLENLPLQRESAPLLPRSLAKQYSMVPVSSEGGVLSLAMEDPLNFVAIQAAEDATHQRILPLAAAPAAVERAINELYGSENAERALQELRTAGNSSEIASPLQAANRFGMETESTAPTIRLVNSFLEYAVEQNASDIHMEPRETELVVRMRIDGLLRQVFTVPHETQSAVIARVKVMGSMDIAEHRVPLDGRSNIRIGRQDIDLRISTLPTVYGEKAVIRLLYKSNALQSPESLGLTGKNLDKFNHLLANTNGVILLVGPTGCGKSSSMYTMIRRLNTEQVNLVTLEDPVEYNIDGVNQVQINEKTGLTFASGLRSILRQDPDIIAVGEIRDGETADIAMRAALTGHLVLSTTHTNDAPSTLDRLRDIGVEPYLTASALKGIISQRLVRRICPNCRETYPATEEEQRKLQLVPAAGRRFYRGRGCPMCFHTGYRGRTAVFEILVLHPALSRAIAEKQPRSELARIIAESDFEPLLQDCVRLVTEGVTTAEEACRTIYNTNV